MIMIMENSFKLFINFIWSLIVYNLIWFYGIEKKNHIPYYSISVKTIDFNSKTKFNLPSFFLNLININAQ